MSGTSAKTRNPKPARRRLAFKARLKAYFLAGVLVMAPISITLYLAWLVIHAVDVWVGDLVPGRYNPETYLPFSVPGIGALLVLASLTLIGMLTAGYLGHAILRAGEAVLARMPVLRTVYGATKQLLGSALAPRSPAFRQVVLFEYPGPGMWAIGLVTGTAAGRIRDAVGDELVSVFLPKAITAYRGFTLLLPRRDLTPLSLSLEEAYKLLVSAGIGASARQSPPSASVGRPDPAATLADPPAAPRA